jgi:hypothetical protein
MNRLIVELLGLAPGLAVALAYGRLTGDINNSLSVCALIVGIWLGLKFGRLGARRQPDG